MIRRRLQAEEGWALVTATIVISLMMGVALAGFAYVDTEQREAGVERLRESSFNLSEGLLETQTFIVARDWPDEAGKTVPACTSALTAAPLRCPSPASVAATFNTTDTSAATSWSTRVHDNGGSLADHFSAPAAAGQPGWDQNGDGRLWVRAEAVVRGRKRALVAQVRVEVVDEAFPRSVITAGGFEITNSGGHGDRPLIDAQGASPQPAPPAVRCLETTSRCAHVPREGQLGPTGLVTFGLDDGGAALSSEALDRLEDQARLADSHHATCDGVDWSARVVFIEQGECVIGPSDPTCCSSTAPGMIVIRRGTLEMRGNSRYLGLVYLVNEQRSSGVVASTRGGGSIRGAVLVDGAGRLDVGSNAEPNVEYDDSIFESFTSYPSGAIVPGSWRELEAGA